MANPWFRMYSEFATDPKVQMLCEKTQRRFVMLLCLRCSNGNVTLPDEEVAFQLRISNEEWLATKDILMGKDLINEHNMPVAWDKRQYVSDSSTARVRKYRERQKRERNVSVTPPDTDTDTDTDIKEPMSSSTNIDHAASVQSSVVKKNSEELEAAKQLLDYLNEKAQRQFKHTKTNLELIRGRLREGYTPDDLARVIERKCEEWLHDAKMSQYLRPATLFNASKFNSYAGNLSAPIPTTSQASGYAGLASDDLSWAEGLENEL